MARTKDRFEEFNNLRENLISNHTLDEAAKITPSKILSKKRRQVAKLEKWQRRTNMETEQFLKTVNLIKKNVNNLKIKVEDVRKRQGILFSAPFVDDKQFLELEKSGDAVYSDCYTIQTQIRNLEQESRSKYGSQRKMRCMQKEYLLSQLTQIMNDFRQMQTGYVEKRKRQYRENWFLSTEQFPNEKDPTKMLDPDTSGSIWKKPSKSKVFGKFSFHTKKSKKKSTEKCLLNTTDEEKSLNRATSNPNVPQIEIKGDNSQIENTENISESVSDGLTHQHIDPNISKRDKSKVFGKFLRGKQTQKNSTEESLLNTNVEQECQSKEISNAGLSPQGIQEDISCTTENINNVAKNVAGSEPIVIMVQESSQGNKDRSVSKGSLPKVFTYFSFKKMKSLIKSSDIDPDNDNAPGNKCQSEEILNSKVYEDDNSKFEKLVTADKLPDEIGPIILQHPSTDQESTSKGGKSKVFSRFSFKRQASKDAESKNIQPPDVTNNGDKSSTCVLQKVIKGDNPDIEMNVMDQNVAEVCHIDIEEQLVVEIETEKSRQQLKAIQNREERLKKLEQNMVEMTELHNEIYSIVHSESDRMNQIEYYVDTAQFNVEVGRKQLTLANKLRKKSLKTKILFGVGVIMVSLIIIIVILATVI